MTFNILVTVFLLFSCNNAKYNRHNSSTVTKENIICNDSILIGKLLQKTLDIENLQQYYPVDEVKNRGYLVLMINEQVSKYYDLYKYNKKVLFATEDEIRDKKISAYLTFKKVDIKNDLATITLLYSTQGIKCDAVFKKEGCDWILKDSKIVER
ncbi:MAG: hypothetical protein ACK5MG_07150 [Bacteroidales bacterium]